MSTPSYATPRLLPLGDSAWTVEFAQHIDPAIHSRVMALEALVDDMPVALLTIDAERGVTPANKVACRLFDRHDGMRPATRGERFDALRRHEAWATERGIRLFNPRDSEYRELMKEQEQ